MSHVAKWQQPCRPGVKTTFSKLEFEYLNSTVPKASARKMTIDTETYLLL